MVRTPCFLADAPWLEQLLGRLPEARVAVFGDLCLDAYWLLNPAELASSLETGLPVHSVRTQRYSPGGAGNVAVNLAALGVGHVELLGVVGDDLFGGELMRQLTSHGLKTDGLLREAPGYVTPVYVKPYRGAEELNRFDLGPACAVGAEVRQRLLACLGQAAARCPVVVINQQITGSWDEALVVGILDLIARYPRTLFLIDSREHAGRFPGAVLKLNFAEAVQIASGWENAGIERAAEVAAALAVRQNRPVMVTRGESGLVLSAGGEIYDIPGIELPGAVDTVGAGDTALAALSAALAIGTPLLEAATLANLAAAITTRQVGRTGVATPDQLRAIGPTPDYVHAPRLSTQPHLARYREGTRIELVTDRTPGRRIRHAIFDHDGTLSTLRQGWEAIMEPLMIKAILGPRLADCSAAVHAKVVETVRTFIDRTTGIQTLAQMKGLVSLVREAGFVPATDILDEHGYKALYNDELLKLVHGRLAQLERGELTAGDWEIKNARALLERLREAGVTLYLASGTDEADVIWEARAMGYAHLFTGGIHGAVGDLKVEAKRVVLERIIRSGGFGGEELVVFGDGPVEIREGRRRGAFTVGLATDEVRRHGMDFRKRTRLIRAGADIIVSDFAQLDPLLAHLGIQS